MARKTETKSRPAVGNLKAELITVAVNLLETEGADALSLRMVARAAGVSHMAPYRHFDNKDALLAAVAETGFRDLVAAIDEAVSRADTDSLKSRAIGMAYIRFARRRPALYRLMFGPRYTDEAQFPDLADAANTAQARCFEAVSLLNPDRGGGESAASFGIAIWSLVHGLANLIIDGRIDIQTEVNDEEKLVGQVLDILGRAVGGNSTKSS